MERERELAHEERAPPRRAGRRGSSASPAVEVSGHLGVGERDGPSPASATRRVSAALALRSSASRPAAPGRRRPRPGCCRCRSSARRARTRGSTRRSTTRLRMATGASASAAPAASASAWPAAGARVRPASSDHRRPARRAASAFGPVEAEQPEGDAGQRRSARPRAGPAAADSRSRRERGQERVERRLQDQHLVEREHAGAARPAPPRSRPRARRRAGAAQRATSADGGRAQQRPATTCACSGGAPPPGRRRPGSRCRAARRSTRRVRAPSRPPRRAARAEVLGVVEHARRPQQRVAVELARAGATAHARATAAMAAHDPTAADCTDAIRAAAAASWLLTAPCGQRQYIVLQLSWEVAMFWLLAVAPARSVPLPEASRRRSSLKEGQQLMQSERFEEAARGLPRRRSSSIRSSRWRTTAWARRTWRSSSTRRP